jgi:5-methylcytosine-specific restriction endonuclease McrA
VKTILEKQNGTCYLSNQNGAYCWNTVKEMGWPYLKMEWAHVVPRCQKNTQTIENLGLMCNRCNNNIQSSRRLEQLPMELLTKTQVILEKGMYDKSLVKAIDTLIKDLPTKMTVCNSK